MKLCELLNTKIDYKVDVEDDMTFMTSAQINKRVVEFGCMRGPGGVWDIEFSENGSYVSTGSGGEFAVFSMVMESLKEFIKKYNPEKMKFTASKNDRARASIYDKLIKRSIKGFKVTKSDEDNKIVFMLERE